MTDRNPIEATNIAGYGAGPFEWSTVRDLLAEPKGVEMICFLGTVGEDGAPHVAGIGAIWFEGDFWIVTARSTRKARNFTRDPRATIATRVPGFDVTFEGVVTPVEDSEQLERLAAIYRDIGWPAEVENGAFTAPYSAQTAGPPPWHVFRFRYSKAIALQISEEGGAMRWRFAA